jgi:hypothetical protein
MFLAKGLFHGLRVVMEGCIYEEFLAGEDR